MIFKKFSLMDNQTSTLSSDTTTIDIAVTDIILRECESGSWLAWYVKRPDIMANGLTRIKALNNLDKMYAVIIEYETSGGID